MKTSNKVLKSVMTAFAILAAATSAEASSRYTVKARCSGQYDVKVLNWADGGDALYVYADGHLVMSAWATKTVDFDGRVETVSYKAGDIFEGGASLRIRASDNRIPATAGSAHLTYDSSNPLLRCSVY